jgi:hypothetical protein
MKTTLEQLIKDLTYISAEEFDNFCTNYSIEQGNGQELLYFLTELKTEEEIQEVLSELTFNTPSLNN